MKIAVVGCGAVGSYYGAMLARAGHDVHFLLRSDYEVVRRQGISILSPQGDFQVHPKCARRPDEIGPSELVLIGLKTTANARFGDLLPPLAGQGAAIVTLQNGLGNEEQLARLFPAEQILGGLCFVCLNRLEPGVVRHTDHGQIMLGEFLRPPEARTHELAAVLRRAGVPCAVTDDLARTHWEKLTWNIPFNGLGVAAVLGHEAFTAAPSVQGSRFKVQGSTFPCSPSTPSPVQGSKFEVQGSRFLLSHSPSSAGSPPRASTFPTDKLLADPGWEKLLREVMIEVIRAARALGFDIPESLADTQIERTRSMGAYKASTLLDFERGRPLELESMFLEPCRRAQQAGVAVPRLERLCEVLRRLDPGMKQDLTVQS